MVNFLLDRLELVFFFVYYGIDCFGFWYMREGCKDFMRYGVLFICFVLRVIDFEVVIFLDMDFYINVFFCFICVCGLVW